MTFDVALGARAIGAQLGWPGDTTCDIRVLGEEPGQRLVVEYVRRPSGPSIIGKFYADRAGEGAFRALRGLDRLLAREPGPRVLKLPRVLLYDDQVGLLAQQFVAGTPYPELLRNSNIRPFFERAGQALGVLHRQRPRLGRTAWLEDHLRDLIHPHPRTLMRRWPEYAPTVTALLEGMAQREHASRGDVEPTAVHRDFHLRQLFFDAGEVGLIDWDLFARGDPALDVGNFLVYLETHLAPSLARQARMGFLAGYGSGPIAAMIARIPLYQAFTHLRLACKSARLQAENWRARTWQHLRTADRYLAAESLA